jgi:hypothetical protein
MLLKIILVIVFVKILIDTLWIQEGLTLTDSEKQIIHNDFSLTEDISLQSMDERKNPNHCNVNIIFPELEVNKEYPYIDPETKQPKIVGSYSNGQNLFNSLKNIKKAANPRDCDNIIST